jgi:hypothetical protein
MDYTLSDAPQTNRRTIERRGRMNTFANRTPCTYRPAEADHLASASDSDDNFRQIETERGEDERRAVHIIWVNWFDDGKNALR